MSDVGRGPLSTTVMVMIESWMFDSLTAEVSYRAQQLQRAQWITATGGRRRRRRSRADKSLPFPVQTQPVDAADSRTEEKVSAG
jgi:hypothetical protein